MNCHLLLLALAATAALYAQRLAPVPFEYGKVSGWRIKIPGNRPLATPAVVNGKVFAGGGFGSHEFYALEASTGKQLWVYHTADDGPTAAVVSNGRVVFNTESCELEVITLDGKPVWKKWLGDPLMSMPAIADGVVYMAYPNSRGDSHYYFAAFDLESGKELWKNPIAGEIITAPVVDADRVYMATIDGSLVAFKRRSGEKLWEDQRNATSAPAVWNERFYFSRREATQVTKSSGAKVTQQNEVVAAQTVVKSAPARDMAATMRPADYLDYSKRAASKSEAVSQAFDAAVGFSMSKGSANMVAARANLGQASVHGIWAYQGSKPFVDRGHAYSAMGNTVMSVDVQSGEVLWNRTLDGDKTRGAPDSTLTPPAIVNGKVFVGSSFGEVFALSEWTGEILWTVEIGEPVVFQPAIASGRVYVGTNNGSIFCFNTGDPRDDGWLMWGGTSAHNGLGNRLGSLKVPVGLEP